ncbi:Metastasis-associated protein mta1, partial [Tyrophagus putrescentiae]
EAFDAFWDEEARNPNRNRIRIGRQYQAQVAPILKSGESDGRRLEDLETLTWNPHNPLSATQLRDYFAIAQSIGLFVQAVDTCHEGGLDEEEDDLEEDLQEERPFEILRLDPTTTNSSEVDANSIFSTGNHHHHQNQSKAGSSSSSNAAAAASELHTKASITTRQQRLQQQQKSSVESAEAGVGGGSGTSGNASSSSSSSSSSLSPLKHTTNTRIQTAFKGLSHFIAAHHSPAKDGKRCKLSALTSTAPSTSSASSSSSTTTPSPTLTTSADAVTAAAGHSHSQPSQNPPINLGESEQFSSKTLSSLLLGVWSPAEAKIFARALTVCGKNFSAIKKDHLPWKSVHSIIEFYYLSVDKEREAELQGSGSSRNKRSPNNSKQPQQPDRGSSKSPLDEGKAAKAALQHHPGPPPPSPPSQSEWGKAGEQHYYYYYYHNFRECHHRGQQNRSRPTGAAHFGRRERKQQWRNSYG